MLFRSIPEGVDLAKLRGSLDEYEAKNLFSAFGIPGVREVKLSLRSPDLSAIKPLGEKIVLKILSGAIAHKTEVGGVALNVLPAEVSQRMHSMSGHVQEKTDCIIEHFLAQEMVQGGLEFMVGMHRDPLGTAILVGMGGVTAELFKDTQMRFLTPGQVLSEQDALDMLKELKTWPLLDGYRGRAKCDVNALTKVIVQFSNMAASLEDRLLECEINPIFVFAEGQGVKAADGIAVFK